MTRAPRWRAVALLCVIAALAVWLRSRGLAFGLPAVYNMDEVAIMSRALAFAKGDLNPHNFLYPTFYFYVLFGWIGAYFVAGRALGLIPSLAAFQQRFFTDPTGIYLAGRALSVACGVATVIATYRLARRLGGVTAGYTAALLIAAAPFAVRDAHYVKHDVPVTLVIVLALLAMSRVLTLEGSGPRAQGPGREGTAGLEAWPSGRWLLLASALTGVAFSTHYYAVFLALPLALTVAFVSWTSGLRAVITRLVWCALIVSAVFLALSPFLLVEPGTALRDIVANRQIVVDRAGAASGTPFGSSLTYARMLGLEALGGPLAMMLAVAGAAWIAWRSWRVALWLAAFPVAFLAFISNTVAAGRYLNPVLPVLAVLAGVALGALAGSVRSARWWRISLACALAVAALWPAVLSSVRTGDFFRQDDTRTQAQRFLEATAPPAATVLVQPYSVPLTQSRESLVEALTFHLGDAARASTKFALRLQLDPWPAPAYRTLYLGDGGLDVDKIYISYREVSGPDAVARLRNHGVHYVVVKRYNTPDQATAPLLSALRRDGRMIASFSPYRSSAGQAVRDAVAPFLHNTDTPIAWALERPGPVMEVWAIAQAQGEPMRQE